MAFLDFKKAFLIWKMSSQMHPQPSPPAPAANVQLASAHGASVQAAEYDVYDYGGHDYGDQLAGARRRVFYQACAAIFAGVLGLLAVILETIGFSKTIDDQCSYEDYNCNCELPMIGPGVGSGILCVALAVWAGFLLFKARNVTTLHAYSRLPIPRNLLCNASAFTTFSVFTFLGLLACGTLSMFFNGDYGKAVGTILHGMAVATLTASILGCCALCKEGCGSNCCDFSVLHRLSSWP